MPSALPATLVSFLVASVMQTTLPRLSARTLRSRASLLWLLQLSQTSRALSLEGRANGVESNSNGTSYVWSLEDTYAGKSFFDTFDFFTGTDPTNGMVNYTDKDTAISDGLAYVTDDNIVIMRGDNMTTLAQGVYRNSVRVSSQKQYNTGLFILDINMAPWGCAVWPAWWTVGGGQWPFTGEIDIIEGVHDNEHNQVTWHSGPNCNLTENANYSGSPVETNGVPNSDCYGLLSGNAGCGIVEWSRASYGPIFDSQGGGVFAMKWDEDGIAVWSFYRAAVPADVVSGEPTPSTWGVPVAVLEPSGCNPITNFVNHSIVFDITFCGDWAGNSYATSGCPGTCAERLMDPSNFVNASWEINALTVYRKQTLSGRVNGASHTLGEMSSMMRWTPLILLLLGLGISSI
ncbi:glycoside hydrolase family 16 protein [Amylocystis lapponica]|nr:glycoside hydrolase family 16 protein [Amylocystis lapponica]